MKDYIKLLRIKHYIKNLLIFVPLFFSKELFERHVLERTILGAICFSIISSVVYILNDIKDVEKDRIHPKKKNRPIASGKVSKRNAVILLVICFILAVAISFLFLQGKGFLILMFYFGLNVAYSVGLKNIPIIDIIILTSGFVIRIVYGGGVGDIEISKWLYLVVLTGALCMGLGKRRNELRQQNDTREVLNYYSESFLDKNIYVAITLVIVFYALWTVEFANSIIIWTVPVIIVILMRYSFDIEGDSEGDPVEILLNDKILMIICVLYIICVFILLYFVR